MTSPPKDRARRRARRGADQARGRGMTRAARDRWRARLPRTASSSTPGSVSSERARDVVELDQLADGDTELEQQVGEERAAIAEELGKRELDLLFTDPYANHNAVITISVGQGGVEAQDWVEMLLRMYLKWAERRGFETESVDESRGEEAGLKSVTFIVRGSARVWLAALRARRASTRAYLSLRPEPPPPHFLRPRRGHARARERRRGGDRHQPERPSYRHLPLDRCRRAARQQNRLRHPHHAPARPGSS